MEVPTERKGEFQKSITSDGAAPHLHGLPQKRAECHPIVYSATDTEQRGGRGEHGQQRSTSIGMQMKISTRVRLE